MGYEGERVRVAGIIGEGEFMVAKVVNRESH